MTPANEPRLATMGEVYTDPAFRGLVHNVWSAALVLLLVAAAHLGLALLRYYLVHDPGLAPAFSDRTAARAELVADLAVSAAMVACYLWARRSPLAALTVAFVVWLSIQSVTISIGGLELFSARILVAKIGILVVLVRGIISAVIARRLRARLAPPRPEALPVARATRVRR